MSKILTKNKIHVVTFKKGKKVDDIQEKNIKVVKLEDVLPKSEILKLFNK